MEKKISVIHDLSGTFFYKTEYDAYGRHNVHWMIIRRPMKDYEAYYRMGKDGDYIYVPIKALRNKESFEIANALRGTMGMPPIVTPSEREEILARWDAYLKEYEKDRPRNRI